MDTIFTIIYIYMVPIYICYLLHVIISTLRRMLTYIICIATTSSINFRDDWLESRNVFENTINLKNACDNIPKPKEPFNYNLKKNEENVKESNKENIHPYIKKKLAPFCDV